MQKSLLKKAILALAIFGMCFSAEAQLAPKFEGNWHLNYVGANFAVTAPAAIAGTKKYTITNENKGYTTEWGRAVDSTWLNVPLVKAYDSLGVSTLVNGTGSYPSLVGKFALIYRGTNAANPGGITFTQKACYCQQAGAIGVIIVNNVPGDPIAMANTTGFCTVNIPVLMVSDIDGNAMNSALNAGQSVTITLSGWGTGFQHDIAIIPGGPALWHSCAVPLTQMGTDNGNPLAYKGVTGAFLANFGTSNESGLKLVSKVTFTPTGGAASQVYADSLNVSSFTALDSVIIPQTNNSYDLHATSNGRFDVNYSLSMNGTDQAPLNNTVSYPVYVNDSIFSKGRYDFVNGKPIVGVGSKVTGGTGYVWGPMYYVAKGGYAARKVQYTVTTGSTTTALSGLLNVYLFRWVDGAGGNAVDGKVQNGELTIEGVAPKTFAATDTNYHIFTVNMRSVVNSTLPVKLKDSSWYWVAADVPSTMYLGCDGDINYYPRSYVRSKITGANKQAEFYAPLLQAAQSSMGQNLSAGPQTYAFENAVLDSVRFWNQNSGIVPAIALHISKNVLTSVERAPDAFKLVELYPNPANSSINVRVKMLKYT